MSGGSTTLPTNETGGGEAKIGGRLWKIDGRVSVHLDFLRGFAALVVCVSHLRLAFFQNASAITHPNIVEKIFYFTTRFGPQAVMIFFVLSGLFVGSSVIKAYLGGRWSWTHYLVARVTRLQIVLIPAILLTALLDTVGVSLFGLHGIYIYTPHGGALTESDAGKYALAGVGNLLFLQTIVVPTFGVNVSLWSLANEFWYYIMFPIAVLACLPGLSWQKRIGAAALLIAAVRFVGMDIAMYGIVWVVGVCVVLLPRDMRLVRNGIIRVILSCMALIAIVAIASEARLMTTDGHATAWQLWIVNLCLAIATAFFIFVAAHDCGSTCSAAWRGYARVARLMSRSSYTLYLVNIPLIAFLSAWIVPSATWKPDAGHIALGGVIMLVVVLFAFVLSHVTEYHTDAARKRVMWFVQDIGERAFVLVSRMVLKRSGSAGVHPRSGPSSL